MYVIRRQGGSVIHFLVHIGNVLEPWAKKSCQNTLFKYTNLDPHIHLNFIDYQFYLQTLYLKRDSLDLGSRILTDRRQPSDESEGHDLWSMILAIAHVI